MKLVPDPIFRAAFLERPNRFLVRFQLDGRNHDALMPNPGRLSELLLPGATLYVSESDPQAKRKTRFTVWAVERQGRPVFLHTHQSNQVARFLLTEKRIPGLTSARVVRAEAPHGRRRFDFLLEEQGGNFFLEVKSVTLFGNGAAMFPDAVTDRGRHHLLKLAELGDGAQGKGLPLPAVLFLVHSDRVDRFLPDYHTDLEFAQTFLEVREKVRIFPVSVGWSGSLKLKQKVKKLPVPWRFLEREVRDRGAYLVIMRMPHKKKISVGRLGDLDFASGWYVYVGSAARALTARISRHLRKRKRFRWHIDYLRDQASEVRALPVRSSLDQECSIADSLQRVLASHSPGFGCSDCTCETHLFHSVEKPLDRRDFHEILEQFRMPSIPFSEF